MVMILILLFIVRTLLPAYRIKRTPQAALARFGITYPGYRTSPTNRITRKPQAVYKKLSSHNT